MSVSSDQLTSSVIVPAKAKEHQQKATAKKHFLKKHQWTVGIILPLLLVILWQLASELGWISELTMSSPAAIASEFAGLAATGELFVHLGVSVRRALLGFVLGASIGLALGIASGFYRPFERVVDPSLQMLRTVPHLAITPLFILWFGIDEISKVLLVALGAFFPLYVNTFLGIRNVDRKLFDVARVLEFSYWKQIRLLILPAALPNILLGVRLSLGVSWLGLVVAEMMGSSAGVGYLIQDARQFSQTSIVFLGIVIFAIVGKLTDSLVRVLEKKMLHWRDSYSGE